MKNSKRVIAGAMALLSAVSVASCGSSSSSSSSSYVDKVKVASTDDISAIPEGSEKELEWLSYFDINPTKKEPEKRTDLTLFEEKGGKIKYSQTSSMNKYDKLAARLKRYVERCQGRCRAVHSQRQALCCTYQLPAWLCYHI